MLLSCEDWERVVRVRLWGWWWLLLAGESWSIGRLVRSVVAGEQALADELRFVLGELGVSELLAWGWMAEFGGLAEGGELVRVLLLSILSWCLPG